MPSWNVPNILASLNGGVKQPSAPPGSVPGGTQLDMMKKFIEDSQKNPEQAAPAYNWAQPIGNAMKSLAAGIMQPQLNAATAINPQSALGGGAPQTAMAPQASAGQAPQQVAALPQGGVDASSFTTPNAQTEDKEASNDNARPTHNYRDAASRNNNPGAMWPGPIATKWGSTSHQDLADGHGNKIATFDDPVKGAAAQFDLLDKKYTGIPIGRALRTWSTNAQYALSAAKSMGMDPSQPITPELLRSPAGIKLAASMAKMEAGHVAPLSKEQWLQAQTLAFGDDGGLVQHGTPQVADATNDLVQHETPEMTNAMGLGAGSLVQKASLTPPGPAQITGQQPAAQPQEQPVSAPQGQGAPVQQVAQRAPGQAPASYSVVPPNAGLSWQDMQHLYQLPKEVREDILKNRSQAFQPQAVETPQGTNYYRGIDNAHQMVGKPIDTSISGGGASEHGVMIPTEQGNFQTHFPGDSGGPGPASMKETFQNLGEMGGGATVAHDNKIALQKDLEKYSNTANNSQRQLDTLAVQRKLIDDPTFSSGILEPETTGFKNLVTQFGPLLGIDPKAPASANELVDKLRAKEVLSDLANTFSGAGLGRVMAGEVNILNTANGTNQLTQPTIRAINTIATRATELNQKIAREAMDYANSDGRNGQLDKGWRAHLYEFLQKDENRLFKPGEIDKVRETLELPANGDTDNKQGTPKRKIIFKGNKAMYEDAQ